MRRVNKSLSVLKRLSVLQNRTAFLLTVFSCVWCLVFITFGYTVTYSASGQGPARYESERIVLTPQTCVHPQLLIDDPVMVKFLQHHPPAVCNVTRNCVYVLNGTVRILRQVAAKNRGISCDYYPVLRLGDGNITWGPPTRNITSGFKITSDFFRVTCKARRGRLMYNRVHAGVALTQDRSERPEVPLDEGFGGLGVAILGFDSMSRMSWLRRLPKTRAYFHDVLGAIELEHHNIVGDGTTAVMLPMLTGKFEWELPECRRNFPNATTMDDFPFLWHDFKKAGYLTSWSNAAPFTAPFNYRMHGFEHQPTDFYTRPFYLAAHNLTQKDEPFCLGSQSQSQVWLNYFRDIFVMYKEKRKFLLHFLVEMSHDDNNLITMMDDDIKRLVHFLYTGGYLNNTVLILMGDHGARYSEVRSTWSGKMEERLPYMSFLFPKWFERKFPEAMKNFRANRKRLTTPFDMHETFRDFLQFGGTGSGDLDQRGISLFKEIPSNRTCSHAGIAPHWCSCLSWEAVSPADPGATKAMQTTIQTINRFTSGYRPRCALLSITNVTSLTKLQTNRDVLKFTQADSDGGISRLDFNSSNESGYVLYQLTFGTSPGGGEFEVTVTNDVLRQHFSLNETDISRINKFGNNSACILKEAKQIRQYCYCKNNIHHDI
ncbi:hypothetical protein BgiMline_014269 [Biomphalaria glabrata]|nr:CAunnamed protein product [Biomphalaria glabrata]KAI8773197.1 CAunnamed protein product [Biomphalaria glabrata]